MTSGSSALFKGFSLISQKGIRRYVYVPILINFIMFASAFYWMVQKTDEVSAWVVGLLPDWLSWLNLLVLPLAIISFFVMFIFFFTTLANFIAAPFHGLLASKVEAKLNPQLAVRGENNFTLMQEIGRALGREWQKQMYFLPRMLGFLILLFILPVIGQILWFLFVAWMMAVQYCDFCFDNHAVSFKKMRETLNQQKGDCFGFGITTSLLSMLPFVNLIIMPVAVCGATVLWCEKLHHRVYN
ncbi:sulfate transporter CysZ [Gayadomonas joobiniege]|uniref:sulfate transporter CysZ n=1 Tax=Gayadomonas joobiniege TaxID=1234606 RepID=UPI00036130FB|nr:sulfate transporter CysZ [Gayadomonas joobiniege]